MTLLSSFHGKNIFLALASREGLAGPDSPPLVNTDVHLEFGHHNKMLYPL